MPAREIRAAACELAGEPLLSKSVKAALSANVAGEHPRFRRVRHGVYQLARDVRRCTSWAAYPSEVPDHLPSGESTLAHLTLRHCGRRRKGGRRADTTDPNPNGDWNGASHSASPAAEPPHRESGFMTPTRLSVASAWGSRRRRGVLRRTGAVLICERGVVDSCARWWRTVPACALRHLRDGGRLNVDPSPNQHLTLRDLRRGSNGHEGLMT